MDTIVHIRGVPIRSRSSVRKESVSEGGTQAKSHFRNKKELCSVSLELQPRDIMRLTEVLFVCLPGQREGDDVTHQSLSSLPGGLCELLKSLHVHRLKNDEVLLLRDSRRLAELRDARSQRWLKALCVLRHNPHTGSSPQATVASLMGLLGCYMAGVHYMLELQAFKGDSAEPSQPEDDDTNQSISSIEDDFVTALEHLEEEDPADHPSGPPCCLSRKRDVASQTIPAHQRRKELSGSRVIFSSSKTHSAMSTSGPSVKVQRSSSGVESQWTYCRPGVHLPSPSVGVSESEESECSSPSPVIFLDEVGYQKSLLAKLDIPQIPGGPKEKVEDSDSEVSEFFDSFDQFDDLEELSSESCTLTLPLNQTKPPTSPDTCSETHSAGPASKHMSLGCSTRNMNPHCFDQPTLPANVKKPTPMKPGSPFSLHSDGLDSPWLVQTPCEDTGGPLFSPVSSSAFSPLVESSEPLEDRSELRKPQDLCSLYNTYSDFASNLSKEILGSVCGSRSAVDISDNRNLSCVCQKRFQNNSGYLMKLADIQETVTVAKLQEKSSSLKDGIHRFASDLVEMSLGSALRDFQKGVNSCTTTLCHLAARLTSSVFQMAFHEIGMRHAYVLKERAINGLAGFLVSEAVAGALREFLTVKKHIFHSTVSQFAADLAEELVFEGIMEVCQFSHPSTPLTPGELSFGHGLEEEEVVVSSYASDLSESVIQEAFIELSQADVTFTSQAAISVSPDNICYVSAENSSTCNTSAHQQALRSSFTSAELESGQEATRTVKKALFTVSGMASCIPVPQAGRTLYLFQDPEETSQQKPTRTTSTTVAPLTSAAGEDPHQQKEPFQTYSGNMVDLIITEACELITASKVRKSFGDCADFLTKTIGSRKQDTLDTSLKQHADCDCFRNKWCAGADWPTEHAADDLSPPVSFQTGSSDRVLGEASHKRRALAQPHLVLMNTPNAPGTNEVQPSRTPTTVLSPDKKVSETPHTPRSTPQQHLDISKQKEIKQFSRKLKTKLAKEFSPVTPPPAPHSPAESGPGQRETNPRVDKAEFMSSLMTSQSEKQGSSEDGEEEAGEGTNRCVDANKGQQDWNQMSSHRMSNKQAILYAERLVCHIVSMATEIDNLGGSEVDLSEGIGRRKDGVAQFSEKTLNVLWDYADEVAGEVINDLKKMMNPRHLCPHRRAKELRRASFDRANPECWNHTHQSSSGQSKDQAEQCSADLIAHASGSSASTTPRSSSSHLSSEYPSCESVTDEYSGYLIRVLKKEDSSRELVRDQYASRLAYRSLKLGLAYASRKLQRRSSSSHLRASRSLPDEWKTSETPPSRDGASEGTWCCCKISQAQKNREYFNLINFAESLAYNITCDVTRKLHLFSVRLPKSLTDSCLYKKPKFDNMADSIVSHPRLSKEGRKIHYHSTGSLCDGPDSSRVLQVIEYYGKKIVEDTLKMSLAVGHPSCEHLRKQESHTHSHSQRSSVRRDGVQTLEEGPCPYCQIQGCPHCNRPNQHQHQPLIQRRSQVLECHSGLENLTGVQIPKILVDTDHRAAFAEQMVSVAMETAKRELSNTSLNADSGISHDGTSYAESLTAEIMASALSNVCLAANLSSLGRDVCESKVSQQLSVGDESLCSWSNLSFEEDRADDNSSFLHLSDSNGNSSSWSSLGLDGEAVEECWSFSPSDSDYMEDKEAEVQEESSGILCVDWTQLQKPRTTLLMRNLDVKDLGRSPQHVTLDPQLRSMLQWAAASMADVPQVQLSAERGLQQLPAVVQRLRERRWRVGDLLHQLVRYCEEVQSPPAATDQTLQASPEPCCTPLFQWLLDRT
uniref:A kinase (PRKA) anchor protein 11 n=1 Tax=Nothobranchius kuhntae TaxID=321403 RepID=A0A1A8KMY3_NOTKU